jgi:hypothetical protein
VATVRIFLFRIFLICLLLNELILRHWLYGEVINESMKNTEFDSKKPALKGWFPYKCVRVLPNQLNISQDEDVDELNNQDDKKNE